MGADLSLIRALCLAAKQAAAPLPLQQLPTTLSHAARLKYAADNLNILEACRLREEMLRNKLCVRLLPMLPLRLRFRLDSLAAFAFGFFKGFLRVSVHSGYLAPLQLQENHVCIKCLLSQPRLWNWGMACEVGENIAAWSQRCRGYSRQKLERCPACTLWYAR